MSASHWAVCPQCKVLAAREAHDAMQAVADAYGKVTADEYQAMLTQAVLQPRTVVPTLAEYYEITGAETGTIKVDYGAGCGACGLRVSFSHSHQIDLDAQSQR